MKKNPPGCLIVFIAIAALLLLGLAGAGLAARVEARATPITLDGVTGITQGKRITQIATSPDLPGVMLAGVGIYGGSPMYSLDGGVSWQPLEAPPWSTFYSPESAALTRGAKAGEARFLVAGRSGYQGLTHTVFRGSAGQRDWLKAGIPACSFAYTREYFSEMSVSPLNPQRVYVTRYCDDFPRDMHDGERIKTLLYEGYASHNGGQTFYRIYQGKLVYDSPVREYQLDLISPITPSPVDPDRLYFGARKISTDGGKHWQPTGFPVTFLALDAASTERIYGFRQELIQADVGMTRLDAAAGWQAWPEQPCEKIAQLVAHPSQTGVLFLRCGDSKFIDISLADYPPQSGLFISRDAGQHWQRLSDWSGRWFGPDYGTPGRMLWARDDGLWATTDLGAHWAQLTSDYQSDPERRDWENITPPDAPLDSEIEVVSAQDIWLADMWGALMHWDGLGWRRVSFPNDGQGLTIFDLAFVSADNGWMIAGTYYQTAQSVQDPGYRVYHWNGQVWRQVGKSFKDSLTGITAIGDQAWAVGEDGLITHWDGAAWAEMDNPLRQVNGDSGTNITLQAISMISPEEGWAVGGNPYQNKEAVILHYQHGEWALEYRTSEYYGTFSTISMPSANLGWAGGIWSYPEGMLARWDGRTWQPVTNITGFVSQVSAASTQDAWAGGESLHHWDGQSWQPVDLPGTRLMDLDMLPNGDIWIATQIEPIPNDNFILRRK